MTTDPKKMIEVDVHYEGPAAFHNMPCAVCWTRKAVLSNGVFQPCWECQRYWRLSYIYQSDRFAFALGTAIVFFVLGVTLGLHLFGDLT